MVEYIAFTGHIRLSTYVDRVGSRRRRVFTVDVPLQNTFQYNEVMAWQFKAFPYWMQVEL